MRYFAIGDIHGSYRGLKQCLGRSNFNYEEDTLIGIGDYVDGYPESHLVVEELLKIKNFIGIMGNHDQYFLNFLEFRVKDPNWINQGGQATFDAYFKNPDMLNSEAHQSFFKKLHLYYILELEGKKYGFVHGGWTSFKGLGHEVNKETYYWDRSLWERSMSRGYYPWVDKVWGDLDYAFIGHTTTERTRAFRGKNPPMTGYKGKLINLDQGAGWAGKLTICDVQTLKCWQSDDSPSLYPGFRGR